MMTVARAFVDNVLTKFGICEEIFSNCGLEWTGSDFKKAVKQMGISQNFTMSFNPQSNGLCERYNKSIIEILRCLTFDNQIIGISLYSWQHWPITQAIIKLFKKLLIIYFI